jgi:hypothetical protein
VVGNSSPHEADEHKGQLLPALGFPRSTLGLFAVVVVSSGAGALCLFAPMAFGVGLFALAAMLCGFALLRWAWMTIPVKNTLAAMGFSSSHYSESSSQRSTNWTNAITWFLVLVVGMFVHRYRTNQRIEENRMATAGANEQSRIAAAMANEQSRIAAARANEQYWQVVLQNGFQQEDLPIEPDQTLSSLLERDLARQSATVANVRQQPTIGVDEDLVQAVAKWIGAIERLNKWMERNTLLLLDAARGLTPQQLLAVPNGPDFLELAHGLTAEGLSPEIAELRSISLELDASISELERMHIRLSDRYRDRSFAPLFP